MTKFFKARGRLDILFNRKLVRLKAFPDLVRVYRLKHSSPYMFLKKLDKALLKNAGQLKSFARAIPSTSQGYSLDDLKRFLPIRRGKPRAGQTMESRTGGQTQVLIIVTDGESVDYETVMKALKAQRDEQ